MRSGRRWNYPLGCLALLGLGGCVDLVDGMGGTGGASSDNPCDDAPCRPGTSATGGNGEPSPSPEPVEAFEDVSSSQDGPTPELCEVPEARRYVVDIREGGSLARVQYALELGAKKAPLHSLDLAEFRRFFAPRFAGADLSLSLRPMEPDATFSSLKATPAVLQVRVPVGGERRAPLDVIVAVDVAPRMQPASNVTSSLLEGIHASLPPGDKLSVVAFSDRAEVVVLDATGEDTDGLERLSDFTSDLKTGAVMREGHDVSVVFDLAEKIAGEPTLDREKVLLFVSDGLRFGEAESHEEAMARVHAWRDVNGRRTVGFVQVVPSPEGAEALPALRTKLLDEVSQAGGGVTLFAANPDRARSLFADRGIGLLARSGPTAQLAVQSKLFDFVLGVGAPVMANPGLDSVGGPLPVGVVTTRDVPIVLPCPWLDFAVSPIELTDMLFEVSVAFGDGTAPLVAPKGIALVDALDPLEKRDALIRAAVDLARVSPDAGALGAARERANVAAKALRAVAKCDTAEPNPEDCAVLDALEAFMASRLTDQGMP